MLYNKILLILVTGVCHMHLLFGNPNPELTEFQKEALTLGKTAFEIDNIETQHIFTFKENVFDAKGQFVEQRWSIIGEGGGLSYAMKDYLFTIKIVQNPSTPSTVQLIVQRECQSKKMYYLGVWEGKITHITLDNDRGNFAALEKDAQGNITRLANAKYNFVKKTNKELEFRKIRFEMTYSDDKLASIEEHIAIGKGPSYKELKEGPEKKLRFKTIAYVGNGLSRTVRPSFQQSIGPRDISYSYQFENGVETRTEFDNVTKQPDGSTDKITRNEENQIIKWERYTRTKFNEFETVQLCEYNTNGQFIKLTETYKVEKKFKSHKVSEYTYPATEQAAKTDPCVPENVSYYTRGMDINGAVVEERTDGKYRVKNEQGDWSEWKSAHY
jgi:hypothetical protein